MADSFVIFRTYVEAARKLSAEKQLAFYNWLIDFALDGAEPDFSEESPELQFALDLLFGQIKASLTASKKRYEASVSNGKKGGRPRGQNNLKKPSKNQTRNQTQNQTHNPNDNVNVNDNYYCTSSGEGLRPHSPPNDGRGTKDEPEQIEQNRTGWRPVVE